MMNQTYLNKLEPHIDAGTLISVVPCVPALEAATISVAENGLPDCRPNLVVAWEIFSSGLSMPLFAADSLDDEDLGVYKLGDKWVHPAYQGAELFDDLATLADSHAGVIRSRRLIEKEMK